MAPQLSRVFTNGESNEISTMATTMLRIACIYMTFDAIHLVYAGVFKGSGDLIYPTCLTFFAFWGACLLAYVELNYFEIHPVGVWQTFTALIVVFRLTFTFKDTKQVFGGQKSYKLNFTKFNFIYQV